MFLYFRCTSAHRKLQTVTQVVWAPCTFIGHLHGSPKKCCQKDVKTQSKTFAIGNGSAAITVERLLKHTSLDQR